VLKYEFVVPITSEERPTAVGSCNYHLDYFGDTFGIALRDGRPAHTSCVGFGLERVALALYARHGLDSASWPSHVRATLGWS
jgi:seryl-tRNA synthetase